VKIGGLVNVFVVFVVVFVLAGCIVYVLAVVVSFIFVFLYRTFAGKFLRMIHRLRNAGVEARDELLAHSA
jgi:hypothetical protein